MSGASYHRGESRQDVRTPTVLIQKVLDLLGVETFDCDLAASDDNAVCEHYYTEAQNSLVQPWRCGDGWNWCNPPYHHVLPWVERAHLQLLTARAQSCLLIPASVGSNWFSEHVHQHASVIFLNGRVTFVGHTQPFPKDLMLCLYSPYYKKPGYDVWRWQ